MRRKRRWRSYYGAEQKSLHVKLYFDVLEQLDKEAAIDGTPRNALINQACEYYVQQLDEERLEYASRIDGKCTPSSSALNEVQTYVRADTMKNLQHIALGLECDVETAAMMLLDRAVSEYNTRPFSFL